MSIDSKIWLAIGFVGQGIFTARFLVQWMASEKKRDVVVPAAFWWLSLAGGAVLLIYAAHKQDPVIIVGQSLGVFIYMRNLMLAAKAKSRTCESGQAKPLGGLAGNGRSQAIFRPHLNMLKDKTSTRS